MGWWSGSTATRMGADYGSSKRPSVLRQQSHGRNFLDTTSRGRSTASYAAACSTARRWAASWLGSNHRSSKRENVLLQSANQCYSMGPAESLSTTVHINGL